MQVSQQYVVQQPGVQQVQMVQQAAADYGPTAAPADYGPTTAPAGSDPTTTNDGPTTTPDNNCSTTSPPDINSHSTADVFW